MAALARRRGEVSQLLVQLLIVAQKAESTQVAGYTPWQQLNRQIDKGQRGIAILAPVTAKIEDDESASNAGKPMTW